VEKTSAITWSQQLPNSSGGYVVETNLQQFVNLQTMQNTFFQAITIVEKLG